MTSKEIEKSKTHLRNAGTPTDRNQVRAMLIARLENEIEALSAAKETVRQDFRRLLARWQTRDVPETVPVCAIPSDVHDMRLYRLTAIFALLCEMFLAAWVFSRLGVSSWFGVATALFITITLHGVFLQLFDDSERPKRAIHRIKHVVLIPAIVGFLAALAFGMLARYVYGSLALILLPLFSISLWLGTLSLLLLAAALFTVAHLRGWSLRHQIAYHQHDAEEQANVTFLKELKDETRSTGNLPPI